ncbi:hypothetical protein [Enterococcus hirae]|uniref:hypothetical protein n=1 Tax=Enterococcus hirae TaxID=1354 RepID=UPI001A969ADD|nr:hypothetical protein [Enterococcus hirae]MBO1101391.1 hypothetical protein [Enterococcus hirae]
MDDYLEYGEFFGLIQREDISEEIFIKYLPKASAVLDNVTNQFYKFHNIKKDPITFRATQFKLALCVQIIYFVEAGGDSNESLNKTPQSFSAGRTSISNKSTENGKDKPLVAEDVYIYLEGTGLLYRGVPSW